MTTSDKNPSPSDPVDPDAPTSHPSPKRSRSSGAPEDEPDAPRTVAAGRARIVEASVERGQAWSSTVRVVLERDGVRAGCEREAIGEEGVVLRCAGEATLEALARLVGPPELFALVGAKRMLAFDSAVLLACVRTLTDPPKKLIGCVPVLDDPVRAVVRAILHATNRLVEAMPNAPSRAEETSTEGASSQGPADAGATGGDTVSDGGGEA